MIEELYIKNFILVEEEQVIFKPKLNIITGETGAGKSIILRAINILLGAVAKTDYIGDYSDTAVIEGTFYLHDEGKNFIKENGISCDESRIIITREINNEASTITRINGRRVTVKLLKYLRKYLLDFHGQNQQQLLLKDAMHIKYLDYYGKDLLRYMRVDLKKIYDEYKEIEIKLNELKEMEDSKNKEMDYLSFQLDEINKAQIEEGEIESLEKEYDVLSHMESIEGKIGKSLNAFKDENKIYDLLETMMYDLESIESYDEDILNISKELKELFYTSETIIEQLQDYFYQLSYDEARLNSVKKRLDELNQLMKKYGNSYEDIKEYQSELEEKISKYNLLSEDIEFYTKKKKSILNDYDKLAEKLSDERKKIAKDFEKEINLEFNELNMKHSNIKVDFKKQKNRSSSGIDQVEFLISTNLGQDYKPFKDIVSGGELSRSMLAIKLVSKASDFMPTMIFDEVDAGISGATANVIGKKLKKIANKSQVITITHLPQIASFSDHHISVVKEIDSKNNKTYSKINALSKDGKLKEVAKLISGSNVTEMALKNARELIKKSS